MWVIQVQLIALTYFQEKMYLYTYMKYPSFYAGCDRIYITKKGYYMEWQYNAVVNDKVVLLITVYKHL